MELESLLSRITEEGESSAFDELYYLLSDKLFRYVLSRIRDRDKSKDILQDIFVDLWKSLQRFSYKSDAQFYGFVFTITKRKISRFIEDEKKRSYISIDMQENLFEEDSPVYVDDNTELIKNCVDILKEKYADIIILRYWSGLSFGEISKMLGINEEAARVRHHRALSMLRVIYEKHG